MVYFVTLSLLAVVIAFDIDRRCLYYRGKCTSHCPKNMHPYHTKCDGQTKSQRTCDSPLIYVLGYSCGWSRCDCSGNLVFDENTGLCINFDDCPNYPTKMPRMKTATERRRSDIKRYRVSKRIKIPEEDMFEQT